MTRLILNADDFGYCEAVSLGIIKAHQDGLIKSTTMMVNMESAAHASTLGKQNPKLYIGLHCNIVIGKPCSDPEKLPSLVDENGYFNVKSRLQQGYKLNGSEIEVEVRAQARRFKDLLGYYPTHLEGHALRHDSLFNAIRVVAEELGAHYTDVQFLNEFERLKNKNSSGYEIPEFPNVPYYLDNVAYEYWTNDTGGILEKELVEMHTHPGYIDQYILDNSSYTLYRAKEVEIVCSDVLKEWVIKNKVELITYDDVKLVT